MPLVVIQTTIPDTSGKPFRITEVLERVATTADEALRIAAAYLGEGQTILDFLSARWHDAGGYWLVAWEPASDIYPMNRRLLM
ncbi:MAG: hypothetical protein M0006_10545 [Magnetospirillum sp.]|nr:hypothetical protein [Magnetospirillum sp.]